MSRSRRTTQVFTMSFLDCICCGFGAVVLIYTIMSAEAGVTEIRRHDDMQGEVSKLEEEVLEGYKNLVVLRNTLEKTSDESARASGRINRVLEDLEKTRLELSRYTGDSMATREHVNQLKADIRSLEEGTKRLSAGTTSKGDEGENLRSHRGTGDRQYLTGIRVNGKRVLILVDRSASMLDETLVNILRMRNLPKVQQMLAPKWQRAVATVDWITTQIPPDSEFQILMFNTQAVPAIEGSDGKWLKGSDPRVLNSAIQALRRTAPSDGTSLLNAFNAAKQFSPQPDEIIIVTDGLPTQGATAPAIRKAVDAEQRVKLFDQAVDTLPAGIPVSVILLPMEGDIPAPSKMWRLARATGGVFMMPSRDWP
ncbi:MAG TPA: VWA domain-containing protein [Steroidobacteraceae bacterium]|nr:VWA domain-containing protein [Steroidobacteraceae bacterium]